MLAGNHDHGLAAGWIDARLQSEPAGFLGLEQRFAPDDAGPLAERLAAAARRRALEFAYPGLWLREDVYALHGHYADLHATVPTFERLAAGAMARCVAALPQEGATPDDYEAVAVAAVRVAARAHAARRPHAGEQGRRRVVARLRRRSPPDRHSPARARAQRRLPRPRSPRSTRAGLGPLQASLSPTALRRGYLHGHPRGDRAARHRRRVRDLGPLAPLRPVARATTRASGRRRPARGSSTPARGSTSRTSSRPSPNGSPYWPGTAVIVDDDGPPELVRLLGDAGTTSSGHARGEAGGVDGTPGAGLERELAAVWRPCSTSGMQPGSATSSTRPLTRSTPAPSTTAHTPPAS